MDQVKADFAKLDDERRHEVIGAIAKQLRRSVHREGGLKLLRELAAAGGISDAQVDAAMNEPQPAN